MSKRALSSAPRVVVVSPPTGPAIEAAPLDAATFLIGGDMKTLLAHGDELKEAEALLWIPPGPPAVLSELVRGGHLPKLKWCHGFYAGVDAISAFAREDLVPHASAYYIRALLDGFYSAEDEREAEEGATA